MEAWNQGTVIPGHQISPNQFLTAKRIISKAHGVRGHSMARVLGNAKYLIYTTKHASSLQAHL